MRNVKKFWLVIVFLISTSTILSEEDSNPLLETIEMDNTYDRLEIINLLESAQLLFLN